MEPGHKATKGNGVATAKLWEVGPRPAGKAGKDSVDRATAPGAPALHDNALDFAHKLFEN
jgi:hypothetical protein